jgi:hypothetical protein
VSALRAEFLRLLHRANERREHRLGQSIKDHHALATAEGGQGFGIAIEDGFEVLPVVTHPHIPGRINGEIHLHLQAATHITAGRRNRVSHLLARRPGGRIGPAQLHNPVFIAGEVADPDIVVASDNHGPRAGQTIAADGRARRLASVRTQNRDASPSQYPGVCVDMALAITGSGLPLTFESQSMCARTRAPRTEFPRRLATQTLPWLSTAIPLTL